MTRQNQEKEKPDPQDEILGLEDENRLLKREVNALRCIKRKESDNLMYTNLLVDQIKGMINRLPPPKHFKLKPHKGKIPTDFNVFLSDWHIGKKVDGREIGGTGYFDTDIAISRIADLKAKIKTELSLHKSRHNFTRLNIYIAGDMLDGMGIFPSQHARLSANAVEQVIILCNELSVFIQDVSSWFPKTTVIFVWGNHGRIGEKDSQKFTVNFEYLAAKMVQEKLSRNRNIEIIIPESWFYIHESRGKKIFITHGSTIKGANFDKAVKELETMVPGICVDCFLLGHFHTFKYFEYQHGKRVIINGSLCGSDSFSTFRMHRTSQASQTVFGTTKAGICFYSVIDL